MYQVFPRYPAHHVDPEKKEKGYDYNFMSKNLQVVEFDIMWSYLVLLATFPLKKTKNDLKMFNCLAFFSRFQNWV